MSKAWRRKQKTAMKRIVGSMIWAVADKLRKEPGCEDIRKTMPGGHAEILRRLVLKHPSYAGMDKASMAAAYLELTQLPDRPLRTEKFRRDKRCRNPPRLSSPEALDSFLQSYEWRRLRMEIIKRDGRRCACCGATPNQGAVMNVDHIKPRRTHPELALDPENLQVLCHECNHGKGNWDTTDWREKPVDPALEEAEGMKIH